MNDNSTQSRRSPDTILCTESTIKQTSVVTAPKPKRYTSGQFWGR